MEQKKPSKSKSKRPVAVILSDVHYDLNTLALADTATHKAIMEANQLDVPLIVAGDLHNTKASMRAECVQAMLDAFALCKHTPAILRGNHCSVNERSKDSALGFLNHLARVVNHKVYDGLLDLYFMPYYHDPKEFGKDLATIPKGSTIIMHQGVQGSNSGDYIQDKSALPKDSFEDFRVISGHYHTRQDIACGRPRAGAIGLFSYVGNPYTLTFGEAFDPPKGFQILNSDGLLDFVPTNLRKHVCIDIEASSLRDWQIKRSSGEALLGDLVKVKLSGPDDVVARITKDHVASFLGISGPFRLDLAPTGTSSAVESPTSNETAPNVLDRIIDSSDMPSRRKTRLKSLWKGLM